MRYIGIEKLADNTITQGSGGHLQRVAICRACIMILRQERKHYEMVSRKWILIFKWHSHKVHTETLFGKFERKNEECL